MKNPVEKKDPVKDKKSKYSYRIVRGGDWDYYPIFMRASGRGNSYPSSGYGIGFRIVKHGNKK